LKKYEVIISPTALKNLKKLPKKVQLAIWGIIEILSEIPLPPAAKKLKNTDYYRIRFRDYRIVYSFNSNQLIIYIILIDHRKDVYSNLKENG
jgi:mRNA interferase RelE/StbE